jgi:hypothetical protein
MKLWLVEDELNCNKSVVVAQTAEEAADLVLGKFRREDTYSVKVLGSSFESESYVVCATLIAFAG